MAKATTKSDMIDVEATGPIRHGDDSGITEYAAGDTFTVTQAQAGKLAAAGAVIQPGTAGKTDDDKAAKEAANASAAIDKANAKAEADRQAAADAEAAKS